MDFSDDNMYQTGFNDNLLGYYGIDKAYQCDHLGLISDVFRDLPDIKDPQFDPNEECIFDLADCFFTVELSGDIYGLLDPYDDFTGTKSDDDEMLQINPYVLSEGNMVFFQVTGDYSKVVDYLKQFQILNVHGAREIIVDGSLNKNSTCEAPIGGLDYDFKFSFKC